MTSLIQLKKYVQDGSSYNYLSLRVQEDMQRIGNGSIRAARGTGHAPCHLLKLT